MLSSFFFSNLQNLFVVFYLTFHLVLAQDGSARDKLLLLRGWETVTCYYKLVHVANTWVCKTFPRTWYTRFEND